MKQKSIPDVFILESLDADDVRLGLREGEKIADILRIVGKDPKYYYFTNFSELEYLLALFELSGYRYLHFSTHGNEQGIASTQDYVSYSKFARYLKDRLNKKRLFFSACAVGNQKFVDSIAEFNPDIRSIMAPSRNIEFSHSIATWSAFYLSMFNRNSEGMNGDDIIETIDAFCKIFPYEFFYASRSSEDRDWRVHTSSGQK